MDGTRGADLAPPVHASPPGRPAVGRAAARGAAFQLTGSIASKFLGFFGQIALAYLLLDTDFAVFALAFSITDLLGIVQKLGLREVITSRQHKLDLWTNPVMWIAFAGGLAGVVLITAAAPIAAWAYGDWRLVPLLFVASLGRPFDSVANICQGLLGARMRFGLSALIDTLGGVFQIVLSVILCWVFKSVEGLEAWAAMGLIAARVITPMARLTVLLPLTRPRILRDPQFRRWRYVLGDNTRLFVSNLLLAVQRRGDVFVLGAVVSQAMLGTYTFAFNLSIQPLLLMMQSLTGVLMPSLGKFRAERHRLVAAYTDVLRVLSAVAMPLAMVQAAVSDAGMQLLYGAKWIDAVPILQIFSLATGFDALFCSANAVFTARRDFGAQVRFVVVSTVSFIALAIAGTWLGESTGVGGAIGMAVAFLIHRTAMVPVGVAISLGVGRRIGLRALAIGVRPAVLSAFAFGVPYAIAVFMRPILPTRLELAAEIAAITFVGGLAYLVLLRVVMPREWARVMTRVREAAPARISARLPAWI